MYEQMSKDGRVVYGSSTRLYAKHDAYQDRRLEVGAMLYCDKLDRAFKQINDPFILMRTAKPLRAYCIVQRAQEGTPIAQCLLWCPHNELALLILNRLVSITLCNGQVLQNFFLHTFSRLHSHKKYYDRLNEYFFASKSVVKLIIPHTKPKNMYCIIQGPVYKMYRISSKKD